MHSRRYSFYFALYSLTIHNELVVFVYFDLANNLFFLHMFTILYTCLLFIIWLLLHLCSNYRWWKSAIRHPQNAVFLLPFNNFFSSKYRNHEIIMISPGWTGAFYPFSFPFFVWNQQRVNNIMKLEFFSLIDDSACFASILLHTKGSFGHTGKSSFNKNCLVHQLLTKSYPFRVTSLKKKLFHGHNFNGIDVIIFHLYCEQLHVNNPY